MLQVFDLKALKMSKGNSVGVKCRCFITEIAEFVEDILLLSADDIVLDSFCMRSLHQRQK